MFQMVKLHVRGIGDAHSARLRLSGSPYYFSSSKSPAPTDAPPSPNSARAWGAGTRRNSMCGAIGIENSPCKTVFQQLKLGCRASQLQLTVRSSRAEVRLDFSAILLTLFFSMPHGCMNLSPTTAVFLLHLCRRRCCRHVTPRDVNSSKGSRGGPPLAAH